jgi:hypothetical protein
MCFLHHHLFLQDYKLDNVHACKCVCCIMRHVERVKTVTSWSVSHRICIIIVLQFLLLYFMLRNGCVTCHIVLTLIECNLQILCLVSWLVHCTVYWNRKEHVIKTGSVVIIKWQVEEASAELGLTEAAVRYWFSDWDSSVRLSEPNTYTSPPFHPRMGTVPVSEMLCCFFEYEMVDECRDLLQKLLDLCRICIKKQFPSKQMCL